jgi:PAS domain-containing protein
LRQPELIETVLRLFAGRAAAEMERSRAEDALATTEARLSDAIESIPDGFVLYDAEDRLITCNQAYRDLYCPSSKHSGLLSLFFTGGSGSSWFDVNPLVVDGSSGGFGWSVS